MRRINSDLTRRWPPNDVSSDFRKAHVGTWTGKSATFDSRGHVIPIHEKFVPDAFKDFGVSIDDFDVKTVTSVDVSIGKGIDANGIDAYDNVSIPRIRL